MALITILMFMKTMVMMVMLMLVTMMMYQVKENNILMFTAILKSLKPGEGLPGEEGDACAGQEDRSHCQSGNKSLNCLFSCLSFCYFVFYFDPLPR